MSIINRQTVWSDGQTLTSAALNGEFNNIINDYDGNITNANISDTAAIAFTKLQSVPATVSGVETLSNKTFLGTTKTIVSYTPNAGDTVTLNLSSGDLHFITMPAGNISLAVSNSAAGKVFAVRILQDPVGSRTVNWFSTIKWTSGIVPTLTTTASKADYAGFICTSTGNFDGTLALANI